MSDEDGEMFDHYMRALDEIYRLRRILAHQARVTEVHLDFKTFPKSRRDVALRQVEQARLSATGHSEQIIAEINPRSLEDLGLPRGLSRGQWEAGLR
ncbi:hypothetical protein [Amycolatopsis kentuckyensis]|uniref:hypothetical protein n=1 Tax=Amycolatopsis kentuckyensis TaxID=218823 RepID=UPI000A39BDAE|nr:hypothetical protein [Amycolatopsis kentuckyensis]